MGLNPLRDALAQAGMAAFQLATEFKTVADDELAAFQTVRGDLERQVMRGELTVKNARERARATALKLRERLTHQAKSYSTTPRLFLERLDAASAQRQRARQKPGLESLQQETNRLLRQFLIEQQIQSRSAEFEAKTFQRPMHGGAPAPTLDSLLRFQDSAARSGDDAAVEWTRRQLESFRMRTLDTEDLRRIDLATARPDRLNPRIVQTYLDSLRGLPNEKLELFVRDALDAADANACAAAFLLARETPNPDRQRWIRQTLDGLDRFPDAALDAAREWEIAARQADAQAALAAAEFTAAIAEAEAAFPTLNPPSRQTLQRQEQIRARPVAGIDEPLGLALTRRGRLHDEAHDDAPNPPGTANEPDDPIGL